MITQKDKHVGITEKVHVGYSYDVTSWGLGAEIGLPSKDTSWKYFFGIHFLCIAFWIGWDY